MSAHTIDTAMAKHMVEAAAIRGASIIGQPGGWSVMLKLGMSEKPLGTQRTDKPRIWRSLDRCFDYLKNELHIARFDMLDGTNYSTVSLLANTRKDTSERMKRAHEAAAYNDWLKVKVNASLAGIEDGSNSVISDEEWETERANMQKAAA